MAATDTTISALERNWGMVDLALADLDDRTLANRPNYQCNSISWLLWHMTRVADRFVHSRFQDVPQLWVKEGWHEKFGMDPDPTDFGMGWSADRVTAWESPAKGVLVGYYEAVKTAVRDYIRPLAPPDLEKQIPFPAPPNTVSMGEAIGVLVYDNIVHGGQIAYLRGYHRGMGWYN